MPSIFFMHGINVRDAAFQQNMALLSAKMRHYLPGWDLTGCCWGDLLGARLHHLGDSIPNFNQTGDALAAENNAIEARWRLLAYDPLLELRLDSELQPIGAKPGKTIWERLLALPQSEAVTKVLEETQVLSSWTKFLPSIQGDTEWKQVVIAATEPLPVTGQKVARALTAAFQSQLGRVHTI